MIAFNFPGVILRTHYPEVTQKRKKAAVVLAVITSDLPSLTFDAFENGVSQVIQLTINPDVVFNVSLAFGTNFGLSFSQALNTVTVFTLQENMSAGDYMDTVFITSVNGNINIPVVQYAGG